MDQAPFSAAEMIPACAWTDHAPLIALAAKLRMLQAPERLDVTELRTDHAPLRALAAETLTLHAPGWVDAA